MWWENVWWPGPVLCLDKDVRIMCVQMYLMSEMSQSWSLRPRRVINKIHAQDPAYFLWWSICALLWSQSLQCVWLFATPWTVARQASLSMGFSRQEYWSGLPCPPPGDLLGAGIKPVSPASPSLAGEFFTTSATWEAHYEVCTNSRPIGCLNYNINNHWN